MTNTPFIAIYLVFHLSFIYFIHLFILIIYFPPQCIIGLSLIA